MEGFHSEAVQLRGKLKHLEKILSAKSRWEERRRKAYEDFHFG